MHASVSSSGADDAWHRTPLRVEEARINREPLTGGSADIHKRFDQIIRELLFRMMQIAGCPPNILRAYRSFMTNLRHVNSLAGGLGLPHERACGIPQGCHFSMLIVALLVRP